MTAAWADSSAAKSARPCSVYSAAVSFLCFSNLLNMASVWRHPRHRRHRLRGFEHQFALDVTQGSQSILSLARMASLMPCAIWSASCPMSVDVVVQEGIVVPQFEAAVAFSVHFFVQLEAAHLRF